ncbi:hypothetical protein SERLA73DRAFT_183932 [Serpula lacrymans var. lacrymans S7.3]|uniref:SEP-domain-containing protein n=2 Tax=Serpula lacrymans var. lacrymans TaxID=341189 RepID=F8Q258_SERL3|nr:uncharacterized protein SERLADRAFT_471341 [Serpula lacrymans var. lacrymans S7.9]EGN97269.1 hypothetical protein SERLA73DRAFT_183932 [Serpula lacrymans var. lacrymans S7.3]EGO22865.1 hypothetical protein SERLADRAFT_471341 [Serpula lacrymans var. lacrymans S7.9]
MSGEDQADAGGRTLGGGNSEPLPSAWVRPAAAPRVGRIGDWGSSSSSSRGPSGRGIATLSDVSASRPGGGVARLPPSAADDDDDDDDEDEDKRQTFFAGGERSGLSVENPNRRDNIPGGNVVRDIIRRATEASQQQQQQQHQEGAARSSAFTGGGHTLGSDEVESSYIPDPDATPPDVDTVTRHVTFWRDGFTIEDGELLRYDDPANEELLELIESGRAPPHLLNVAIGQLVNLHIDKRLTEVYTPTKRQHQAFTGSGHRLGSPAPAVTSRTRDEAMPGSFPSGGAAPSGNSNAGASSERGSITTRFEVDQTQPTTSVQIRLADGTRMVCRMNLTHTVGNLRDFINASRPENMSRAYTIGTTFPNRVLEDDSQNIQAAGLVNSVIVQRWA